jgi:hypothetical protein
MTPGEREDFLVEKLGCPKKMLGTVLLALHRTPEQMVEYLHSDDEARTDAILRRWGFDPTVLD